MKRLLTVFRLVAIMAFVGLPVYFGPYGRDWTSNNYGYSRGIYNFGQYPQMMAYESTYHDYSVVYEKGWYSRGLYSTSYSDCGLGSI